MKAVEHLGPQHQLRHLMMNDGIVLVVDPEFEIRRVAFMRRVLVEHAVVFTKQTFPSGFREADRRKRCYDEAARLAEEHRGKLYYCEGIALIDNITGNPFPLPHEWCCTRDGKVVDPTMSTAQHKEAITYWGMPFKWRYVQKWAETHGFHGMLDGHPTLDDTVGVYVDPPSAWKAEIAALKSISRRGG